MDYDKILSHIGELSLWNLINLSLLWLPPMMGGIIVLQTSFSGLPGRYAFPDGLSILCAIHSVMPPSKFRCRMPCEEENATYCDPRFNESMIHPEVVQDFFSKADRSDISALRQEDAKKMAM